MKKSQKQGFTLVELSIVLVIIGLLIGGILVAQSLIDSTKIQAFVRQIGQFDGASLTFKDRFGALPGDAQVTGSTNSDADGYIEDATAAILTFDDELPHVFADLSTTGLKNPDGTDYAATDDTVTLGTVIPESAVGVNLGIIAGGSAAEGGNYWWIGDLSGTDGTDMDLDASDSLLAVDALAARSHRICHVVSSRILL